MDPELLEILVCPACKGTLTFDRETDELSCEQDKLAFPIRDDIPVMLIDEARTLDQDAAS
ncbi:MAG: Trm112 family protein [Magnetococcales bacterium]|nr:Trm112 family protein [Magnetococcales bacterium]